MDFICRGLVNHYFYGDSIYCCRIEVHPLSWLGSSVNDTFKLWPEILMLTIFRFKREEIKIQAWESHQKAKTEAEMREIEVRLTFGIEDSISH